MSQRVVLNDPEVMLDAVEDLAAQIAMAEDGVAGDQAALEDEIREQPEGGLVLVGLVQAATGHPGLDGSPGGLGLLVQPAWYEFTDTTPEQMVGWGWQAVHDPEALPRISDRMEMEQALKQANRQKDVFLAMRPRAALPSRSSATPWRSSA